VAVVFLASVVTLGSATTLLAQASRRPAAHPDSARLTADLFFRAIADEKWETAAMFLDTISMRRMISQQLRQRPELNRREMTVDDFMRGDSTKPREVAEYELKRYREQVSKFDAGDRFSREYYGIRSASDLRALSTTQAAARYLQAKDQRVQLRELLKQAGCGDPTFTPPFTVHRILATALANDSVAYLVHDESATAISRAGYSELPSIMVLRFRGGRWVIAPTPMFMGPGGVAIYGDGPCDATRRR
jgi:hypothetical protein